MVIIYNLIAARMILYAAVIAFVIAYLLGMMKVEQISLIAAPIALILDLIHRGKTGRWLHPRGGGQIFFMPVWLIGLLILPISVVKFFGPLRSSKSFAWAAPSALTFGLPHPIASVADGQHEAVRLYPSLGVANSPLNLEFVRRYRRYQVEKPEFFRDPAWPVTLAKECAVPLGIPPAAQ